MPEIRLIHLPFEHKIFRVILEADSEDASVFLQTFFKNCCACSEIKIIVLESYLSAKERR